MLRKNKALSHIIAFYTASNTKILWNITPLPKHAEAIDVIVWQF